MDFHEGDILIHPRPYRQRCAHTTQIPMANKFSSCDNFHCSGLSLTQSVRCCSVAMSILSFCVFLLQCTAVQTATPKCIIELEHVTVLVHVEKIKVLSPLLIAHCAFGVGAYSLESHRNDAIGSMQYRKRRHWPWKYSHVQKVLTRMQKVKLITIFGKSFYVPKRRKRYGEHMPAIGISTSISVASHRSVLNHTQTQMRITIIHVVKCEFVFNALSAPRPDIKHNIEPQPANISGPSPCNYRWHHCWWPQSLTDI